MSQGSADKVVVVGQGYVGLPLAMRAVEVGHRVVGYEVDEMRVKRLRDADSYVEDIPSSWLRSALDSRRYEPSSDPAAVGEFDVALITVPTPLLDGSPDLSYIQAAGQLLAPALRPGALVVLESTTYPGTTEEFLADLLRAGCGLIAGEDYHLGYSPERIDPGNPKYGLVNTPKIVSGVNGSSLGAVRAFYDSLVERTIPVKSPREAELTKLIENTFRHVNIALVNELAMFAAEVGVDIWDALEAASTKPFGFMRFNPGPGVGGHCLPIDPSYLSWHFRTNLNRSFRFVELANDINDHMPDYVVQRLTAALNTRRMSVNGSVVLVLGVAYKPNTSDMRESPALVVIERLLSLGAEVRYVDDHVGESDLGVFPHGVPVKTDLSSEELRRVDAVVVVTDHDGIDYGALSRDAAYILDTRHRCQGRNVEFL